MDPLSVSYLLAEKLRRIYSQIRGSKLQNFKFLCSAFNVKSHSGVWESLILDGWIFLERAPYPSSGGRKDFDKEETKHKTILNLEGS